MPLSIIHVIPEEEISINTDEWDHVSLMKFSKTKCKVLHLGYRNSQCQYILEEWIENSPMKALGILVDENFGINQQGALAAQKASHILGCK